MLELRPNCECRKNLSPDPMEAMIWTRGCPFCRECAQSRLSGVCPNCGGNLVADPIRSALMLKRDPTSTGRIFKPAGCVLLS